MPFHKKKKSLTEAAKVLLDDADQLATQAEGKAGTPMARLVTESNMLRKRYIEKMAELRQVEEEVESVVFQNETFFHWTKKSCFPVQIHFSICDACVVGLKFDFKWH